MSQPAVDPVGGGPGSGGVDRRARRKAETRRRLLAAARRLFVERGYHATRPQDVAQAADLATGTFYVHFADKRDVFLALSEETARDLMGRVRRQLAASTGDTPFEARLRASLEALLAWSDENPGVLRLCFADEAVIAAGAPGRTSLRERLAAALANGLRAAMQRGDLCADYDPVLVAYGIVGFAQHALTFAPGSLDRATVLGDVTRFCSRALQPAIPPGAPSTAAGDEEPLG